MNQKVSPHKTTGNHDKMNRDRKHIEGRRIDHSITTTKTVKQEQEGEVIYGDDNEVMYIL